jgi:hypothetical protein
MTENLLYEFNTSSFLHKSAVLLWKENESYYKAGNRSELALNSNLCCPVVT